MKKFILFDIDGTLIDNGAYPENFDNIKKQISILKKDYIIGICTYRPFDLNVRKIMKNYGLNGPVISEGGACIFDKNFLKYSMVFKDETIYFNLNALIKNIILDYINNSNINASVVISNNVKPNDLAVVINGYRKMSSTIRFPEVFKEHIDEIISYMENNEKLKNMNITKSPDNELKLNVLSKNINKMSAIEKYFKNSYVTFVTDFEEIFPTTRNSSFIKVFSVGTNANFNNKCDCVFSSFGKGVEEILIKLRSEL